MHISTIILISCALAACTKAVTHDISMKSGEQKRLTHKSEVGLAETTWNLETCEGCKFVVSCHVYNKKCDEELLTIFDGKSTNKFCGSRFSSTVRINSVYNKMSITFMTKVPVEHSMCHVSVTTPFTNMLYEPADSSEHGLGTGATRQPTCKCGWANRNPSRIVGGNEASHHQFPFAVFIKEKGFTMPICGGSIITPYHVLTAAHCTTGYGNVQLVVVVGQHDYTSEGTSYTKEIDVQRTIEHPSYVDVQFEYDIAVVLLKQKIDFNDAVGPVCLPTEKTNLLGEYIKVMGWGRLNFKGATSLVLKHVNLKGIDLGVCGEIYDRVNLKNQHQICTWAPDRDSCQGDSGGPLVWVDPETNRYRQVGIVSYGRDCGTTDPSVNTDVSFFMDWIKQTIADTTPHEVCV